MPEIIFVCLGIFIMSLFWWPGSPVPFEVPKVIFFQWFTRILVIVFAVSFFIRKKIWKVNLKLLIPVLIFAVWATVSSLLGSNISKSFAGNYYRIDGLITLYELIGFAILVSYFWKDKNKKNLSLTFFASTLLLSVLTVTEILTHKFGLGSAATFGNPVFLAGYLVCSLPFTYYFLHNTKFHKIWKILFYIFPVVTIVLTQVWGAVAVMVIYLGFEIARRINKKYRLFLILAGFAVSLTIIGIWFRSLEKEIYLNSQGRDRIYHRVIVGALKQPVFGWGWANVDYAIQSNDWPIKVNDDVYIDKAHSGVLEILTTTGVPGLLIYFYILYVLYKELIGGYKKSDDKLWNFSLISASLLYFFHSQTNVISIAEEVIFWLILGIMLSLRGNDRIASKWKGKPPARQKNI